MNSRLPGFDPKMLAAIGAGARVYELSHAMAPSMPVYHQHIPYSLALHRRHGDPHPQVRQDGSSFANEVIVTSGHSGTHIDALMVPNPTFKVGLTNNADLEVNVPFAGVHTFPARIKCATLGWHAALEALKGGPAVTTTESHTD